MDAFVTSNLLQKRQVEVNVNKEKSPKKKTRKYGSSYINFGLTVTQKKVLGIRKALFVAKFKLRNVNTNAPIFCLYISVC